MCSPVLVAAARLAPFVLFGCASLDYSPVDLQLDVLGTLPSAAETIDMCVEGAGFLNEGAGNGRVMFAGLPADVVTTVGLTFRDEEGAVIGGAGPVDFDTEVRWLEVAQDDRSEPCAADGQPVTSDQPSWVLGVRFSDEPW